VVTAIAAERAAWASEHKPSIPWDSSAPAAV
jgi:hypothetical protein